MTMCTNHDVRTGSEPGSIIAWTLTSVHVTRRTLTAHSDTHRYYRERSTPKRVFSMSIRWSRARLRTVHRQVEHAPFLSLRALLQAVMIAWAAFELWRAVACSSTLVEGQAAQARPRPRRAQPPQRPRKSLHRRWLSYRRAAPQRQRLEWRLPPRRRSLRTNSPSLLKGLSLAARSLLRPPRRCRGRRACRPRRRIRR